MPTLTERQAKACYLGLEAWAKDKDCGRNQGHVGDIRVHVSFLMEVLGNSGLIFLDWWVPTTDTSSKSVHDSRVGG